MSNVDSTVVKSTIVMAQFNPLVGDIEGNTKKMIEWVRRAEREQGAALVIFPELSLCGYPPEDLLLRDSMALRIQIALRALQAEDFTATLIVGYPKMVAGQCFNMAGVLRQRQWCLEYAKQELPNYEVFDEKRYFFSGHTAGVFDFNGIPAAVTVCEDIWLTHAMQQAVEAGARLMINISASPFHQQKQQQRVELLTERAIQGNMPILYVNQVGGQDELVFDGGCFAISKEGQLLAQAPLYHEEAFAIEFTQVGQNCDLVSQTLPEPQSELALLYQTLVLGLRDYVNKNKFPRVVLGLSGGIDSALTLAIAVDALGADRVSAFMMPFVYTSALSCNDAADQAERMGVDYQVMSIEPMYQAFMASLSQQFPTAKLGIMEQNIQARCRGLLLMAISNQTGALVLTTGNKSEVAVGYSTLYGDMAGGFDALKDVLKTQVFALARYRNTLGEVIPTSVITRPPSAELAPDQVDEDNLPAYDILDQLLLRYIDRDQSAETIITAGFDPDTVHRVIRLVDLNEYKRRQAPVGIRVSQKGFGRDRRYPITNGWRSGH